MVSPSGSQRPPRSGATSVFVWLLYQGVALLLVIAIGAYLVSNTLVNLEERSIRTGFGFLNREAGGSASARALSPTTPRAAMGGPTSSAS